MAIDFLFDIKPSAKWLDEMRRVTKPTMATFVSLGIDADLRSYPHGYIFKLKDPIKLDKKTYEFLSVNNYAADPAYSPEGKSALTVILDGDTYDYWKKLKEEGLYTEEKQRLADEIIAVLAGQIPETSGKVEVTDVATPLTYERYCANWKGSWMTEITPDIKMKAYPAVADNISGLYFAGHRMMPPGGLPVALMSGRSAVQYLCRDTDTLFISEE
jgi:phytoene dehydrogenase-like protein